jgi:hypothetical protein
MSHATTRTRIVPFVSLLALLAASTVTAAGPDLEANPVSGNVESVDLDTDVGNRVRHTDDEGHGGERVTTLVSEVGGLQPRIAIDRTIGNSWVVWWTDGVTDQVRYAKRDILTGSWSGEAVISPSGAQSRHPEIVHDGEFAWIAHEIHGAEVSIAVVGITDDPEPFGSWILDTTPYTGDVDVLVHTEANHVWVTWVDSATHVGWSEWDAATESWSQSQFLSYAGSNATSIRKLIRDSIVLP